MFNGNRELNSFEEPCFTLVATITSLAREINPTVVGVYIYIYIYMYVCVCVCVCVYVCVCVCVTYILNVSKEMNTYMDWNTKRLSSKYRNR